MEIKNYRIFTRAALLLSLTILFQSLRLFIPMPPVFSTFLIGSLVNACLLVTVETVGLCPALMIGAAAPVVAWFQQLLPVPAFIFPVAFANLVYVKIFFTLRSNLPWFGLAAAAAAKTLLLYMSITWLLTFVNLSPQVSAGIVFVMSWPQFVTATIGGLLANYVTKRLARIL